MEFFAGLAGELEIRARGSRRTLAGRFPYGKTATVRDRGRTRKERINAGAFDWQLQEFGALQSELAALADDVANQVRRDVLLEQLERRNVHVLSGHDFNRPLGDMKRGTARVESDADSLRFEVDLPDEADMPSWMADAVKAIRTERAGGVSPGFRVPPKNVVPNAERLTPEPGNPGVSIREIDQAVLFEVSVVSRPVYGSTEVGLRAEDFGIVQPPRRVRRWL